MHNIISFGEIVWDIFEDTRLLGGAPLNFAYFCAKRGARTQMISAVGRDALGMGALETMNAKGISDYLVKTNEHPTGKVLVSLDKNGEPSYEIEKNAAWDFITTDGDSLAAMADADAFAFGTLAQRSQTSRDSLAKLLEACPAKCLKLFDANLRQNYFSKDILNFSMRNADIVKLNKSELNAIADIFSYEGDEDARAKFLMDAFAIKYLIITRSAEGHTIYTRSGKFSGPAPQVEVADTVGAGDAFTATFICEILNGTSPQDAATAAELLATEVCTHRGALCLG